MGFTLLLPLFGGIELSTNCADAADFVLGFALIDLPSDDELEASHRNEESGAKPPKG